MWWCPVKLFINDISIHSETSIFWNSCIMFFFLMPTYTSMYVFKGQSLLFEQVF